MYAHPCMQNTDETIAKYAIDANLFRLGSTKPKKNSSPWFFFGFYTGGLLSGFFVRRLFVGGLLT